MHKSTTVSLRVSLQQKEEVRKAAERHEMTISEYIKYLLLKEQTKTTK